MQATGDDLVRFKRCFDENSPVPRPAERLGWQYLRPPAGTLLVQFAVDPAELEADHTARVAGIYAVFPVRMKVGAEERVGVQSLDTLTDHRYRGKGIFTTLARAVYARAEEAGMALVYGFPNGSSAPGFFGKLAWQSLDPLPFLILPLRSRYFLARVPRLGALLGRLPDLPLPFGRLRRPSEAVSPITRFDARVDALWERFSRTFEVGVRRDSAYLNWRFADKPDEEYHTIGISRDGELAGFATYCVKEKHGGRIGYVMELMFDPAHPALGTELLAHAVARMRKARADAVLAWCLPTSAPADAYRQTGFRSLPERFRPIELHFGARAFDPSLAPVVSRREGWYVSYADSDTV